MAVKDVTITLNSHPLSREENGVVFKVKVENAKFGELVVSKGGLRWKRKNKQDHHFVGWSDLDDFMKDRPKK
jgi:hypothetical protein